MEGGGEWGGGRREERWREGKWRREGEGKEMRRGKGGFITCGISENTNNTNLDCNLSGSMSVES